MPTIIIKEKSLALHHFVLWIVNITAKEENVLLPCPTGMTTDISAGGDTRFAVVFIQHM